MSAMPEPHTVLLHKYSGEGKDARGRPVKTYAAPVALPISSYYPPGADSEPFEPGRNALISDLHVLANTDLGADERDEMTVGGRRYRLVTDPEDFTNGPWDSPDASEVGGFRFRLQNVRERD